MSSKFLKVCFSPMDKPRTCLFPPELANCGERSPSFEVAACPILGRSDNEADENARACDEKVAMTAANVRNATRILWGKAE
eukprot:CAMPEP_0196718440 /NCGR_PEP_ID=MMETSP1091-20130531/1634_1 /TAXON_ID=302021 /ORGANISM="Rhodomonas sp., Strain CCMP768" /LENGTH=80 /DNA_ID=CAMNT_0042059093 /DNA_START=746 /DNA_END=985 /DNA_ORIENTATION=-